MDFSSYNMIKWIRRTYAINQKIYRLNTCLFQNNSIYNIINKITIIFMYDQYLHWFLKMENLETNFKYTEIWTKFDLIIYLTLIIYYTYFHSSIVRRYSRVKIHRYYLFIVVSRVSINSLKKTICYFLHH